MYRIPRILFLAIPLLVFANRTRAFGQSASAPSEAIPQAIEMNIAEVDLANLAAGKSQDPRVNAFGEMMMKDHDHALTKLRALPGAPATEVNVWGIPCFARVRLESKGGPEFVFQGVVSRKSAGF